MSAFILYISEVNPPSQDFINRIIKDHETSQDIVLVKKTDAKISGGFMIIREDELGESILRRDIKARENIDYETTRKIAKQKSAVRDGAKYSGDTSIIKGEKPYKKK